MVKEEVIEGMDALENPTRDDGTGKNRAEKQKTGPFHSLHNLESEASETSDNEADNDQQPANQETKEKAKRTTKTRQESVKEPVKQANSETVAATAKRSSRKRPLEKEKETSATEKALTPPAEDSDSVGSSSGRSEQSANAVLLLKPPRKKFLKCGVFYGDANTATKPEPLSMLWTSALAKYQNLKPNLMPEDFMVPYDYWWAHRYQKEFTLSNPSEGYKKIRSNVYFDAKAVVGIKSDVCDCNPNDSCGKDCMNRTLFIECDPDKCPCGEKCTNNRMHKKEWCQNIEMFKCGEKGAGVKATAEIEKGTFICEYVGEVISQKTLKDRMATWYKDCKHHYALTLEADTIIDAYRCGSIARFLNHSCEPNCEMVKWSVNGFYRMGIFALRDIQPGEELCFDYKFHAFNNSQVCLCQSEHCRGLVNSGNTEERQRKSKPKRSAEQGDVTGSRVTDYHSLLKATNRREKLIAIRRRVFLNRNVDCERQKLKMKVEAVTQTSTDDAAKNGAAIRYLSERRDAHRHWRLLQKSGGDTAQLKKLIVLAQHLRAEISKAGRIRPRKSTQTSADQTGNDKTNESITVDDLVFKAETGRYSTVAAFEDDVAKLIGQLKLKSAAATADENRESISLIEQSYQSKKLVLLEPTGNDGPEKHYWATNVPLVGTYEIGDEVESPWEKKADTFDEGHDKIHCVCGVFIESGFMIQCERCFYWQHGDCVNVDPKVENYVCEFCTSGKSVLLKEVLLVPQPKNLFQGCVYYHTLVEDGFQIRTGEFVYVKRDVDQNYRMLLANLDFNCDPSNMSADVSMCSVASNDSEADEDDKERREERAVNFRTMYRRADLGIFRVERLFVEPKGTKFLFGRYFVRPHETHCDSNQVFHRNEVCESSLYDTLPLHAVVGRCLVLDAKTYCQGRPKCPKYPEEDVYVCGYRLDSNQGLYRHMRVPRVNTISKLPYVFETFDTKLIIKRDFKPFPKKAAENARRVSGDHSKSTIMTGQMKKEPISQEEEEKAIVSARKKSLARKKRDRLEQVMEKMWKR